jgi:hypothetical protein
MRDSPGVRFAGVSRSCARSAEACTAAAAVFTAVSGCAARSVTTASGIASRTLSESDVVGRGVIYADEGDHDADPGGVDERGRDGAVGDRSDRRGGRGARRELRVEQLDLEVAKSQSFPEGVPEVVVDSVFGTFGPEAAVLPVSGEVEVLTGRPARTFAHWVARNREALV